MGEIQKEIGKQKQTPDNLTFRHCPKNFMGVKLYKMAEQPMDTSNNIVILFVKLF